MKKRITQRAVAGLLVVLALAFTAGATSAFVGAKPFYLDAPLRFDYVPSGAGDKPILATDLDGNYVKSVAHSNQAITVTLQDGQNAQHTLSIPVGATLTGATYVADTETLTLTLSEGGPITADLSGLTTSSEVATAISAAIAAETDAVLTGATYAADSETLTLTLSEGSPVTGDLSGLTTAAELSGAINAALDGVSGVTLTGASYAADSETLTLTLSEGDPITADLSGLTTSSEVATAISAAIAAETDAVLTGATYAADSETLTLTLSEGSPVTGDLSGLTTAAELSGAINTALAGVSGVTLTGATYVADTETLTLTLSEGEPVTADLSGLTTSSEVATAISAAIAAETDAVLTGASFATDSETLTLTLSEGGPVTASLTGLSTTEEVTAAITNALAAQTDATITSASYAADSELLTLTLSEGDPVTADLSGLTTTEEVSTAISTALTGVTGTTVTAASYTEDTETLTLTLSEGTAVTADLSGLSTDAELSAAIANANATANPRLLGTHEASGATCQVFAPTDIVIPQSGWIAMTLELRNNNGQYIHEYSIPVSLLHNLPVKIDDTATSANVDNNTSTANALSLPVRALYDGYHVGLTNDHRLVARASHQFSPCRISVYTGHTLATSPTSTTSTTDTTPTQNSSIAFDPDTRVLTLTHGDLIVSTANLAHHPFISASTNIIWGISSDATITTDELTYFSNQGSTASILYRAADFNGASAHMAFAIRSPSTVTSLTSAVGGSNLCTSGLWSPCRSNAQITINNRLWNVYLTSSAVALPADAVGVVAWE